MLVGYFTALTMIDWHQERQLYGSPYSGCRCFTGWPKPVLPKIPVNSTWPSPQNAPGARVCCDPAQRPRPATLNLQRAHFRPSAPYPSWVLGPGGEPLQRMCNVPNQFILKPGKPAYDLGRGIRGPSANGPLTYGIAGGVIYSGQDFVTGSSGQASQHNLGLS